MWIGWASAVKLWISQISIAPSAGCLGDRLVPAERVPAAVRVKRPEVGLDRPERLPVRAVEDDVAVASVLTCTVADSISLSETWRVLVAAPSGAIAGSTSWFGGVLGSGPVAGDHVEAHHLSRRIRVGGLEVDAGLPAAERLVGGDVFAGRSRSRPGRW